MPTRHRIPTIFNLSMVDVLCCALGCVILLWLLNLREAKQRAEAAGETDLLLNQTQSALAESDQRGRELEAALKAARGERDQARGALAAAQARLADLDKTLAALRMERSALEDRLAKKSKEQADLNKEMLAARQRISALDILIRDKEKMARATARSADELAERLRDADARVVELRGQAELVPGLRAKAAAADTRMQALEKDLADRKSDLAGAGQLIASLQEDKRSLTDQATRARAAMENRFAGIALTGRRVVFLVDMSGSMELVEENTAAPEKWTEVRQTLARVMRSLTDLEKFQVILFSNKIAYLLGNDERWLDYDPVTSTGQVARALAAIKPVGNTDMYAAFEAAFRFRPLGLDTIYVLSDGLPNIGAGLAPEAARSLKETERAEILSKHVRQTLKASWNRPGLGRPLVRINTIGFFYESPDVGAFLWALARENDGSFVGMSKP
jgi:predicted  nucleic acid-binding Zn-ribbon protein